MADWHVSSAGNDTTGDGSYALPYLTISKAQTSASNGDTIYIISPTFAWVNVTFTKNLTIRGYTDDAEIYVVDGGSGKRQWFVSSAIVSIQWLTFKRSYCINREDALFALITSSASLTISNCVLEDLKVGGNSGAYQGGLFSTNDGNNGAGAKNNVTLVVTNNLVKSTVLSVNDSIVVANYVNGGNATNSTITIAGNTIHHGTATGDNAFNYVVFGIGSGSTFVCKNNIIVNEGSSIIFGHGASPTYSYNCAYGTFTGIPAGTGNLTSDPLFVDAANENHNLRQDSPCIGAGNA